MDNKEFFIKDTQKHINLVETILSNFALRVNARGKYHDQTKFSSAEANLFIEYTPKLKSSTYGSEEYKQFLEGLKPALEHHYANNRHHPEHFDGGIKEMNLLDLIEMIADWYAASKRHNDGDILKSIEINQKRFGYSDELKGILINTVKYMKHDWDFLAARNEEREGLENGI